MSDWDGRIKQTRQILGGLPDRRTGDNCKYSMEDIGMGAFSVFFTPSASFLAHQKTMQQTKGRSNAQSLFQIEDSPCDNHIRQTLDPVPAAKLFGLYDEVFERLRKKGVLETYRAGADTIPSALDGTWSYSSQKIHCKSCSCREHQNGEQTYYPGAVPPVLVAPGQPHAISLRPEFITPQDGPTQQDCEIAAGKRWLEKNAAREGSLKATLLGDDLDAHQPFCRQTLLSGFHFIYVGKPDSHTTLYNGVNLLQPDPDLHRLKRRVKHGAQWEHYAYRYANGVPRAEGADALKANGCELTVTDAKGEILDRNGFIPDFKITDTNVAAITATARARWKIENNNVLKTKGYHLEHNFGHGKKNLASLRAAFNILAFLYHTFLSFTDENYRLIRSILPTRTTFFDDLRALTRSMLFTGWDARMHFMMAGLEIGPYAKKA